MDWSNVASTLTKHGLNLLSSAIPGGPFVAGVVSDLLGCGSTPDEINTALANADPDMIFKLKQLEIEHRDRLELEVEKQETHRLRILNETMRVEYNSNDSYVRRARPTLLYTSCIISLMIAVGTTYAITIGDEATAANIAEADAFLMALVSAMWGACGLYVGKRSGDKRGGLNNNSSSLLKSIFN